MGFCKLAGSEEYNLSLKHLQFYILGLKLTPTTLCI